MNTGKKLVATLTLLSGVALTSTAQAHNGNNRNDVSAAEGVWKEQRYQRGPIRKIVIDKLTNRYNRDKFRVSIWGDCDRSTCFRTGKVLENRNGKLKVSYGKNKRQVVLKISKEGRQLFVKRKVKRNGFPVNSTKQYLSRVSRNVGHQGHGHHHSNHKRKADLAVTYANGRWNNRLKCYEVTATVRNLGHRRAASTTVKATAFRNGYKLSKQKRIRALAPGQTAKVRLIFNKKPHSATRVEVNPGRYVQERNYRNNVRKIKHW